MNNKFNNKKVGVGTIPMFLNGVPFYIRMDVTTLSNEVRYQQTQSCADKTKEDENGDPMELELIAKICEGRDQLIQEQATQILELQIQIADYEQELYENERKRLFSEETNLMEDIR